MRQTARHPATPQGQLLRLLATTRSDQIGNANVRSPTRLAAARFHASATSWLQCALPCRTLSFGTLSATDMVTPQARSPTLYGNPVWSLRKSPEPQAVAAITFVYLKYRSLRCHSVTQQNLPAHDRAIAYDREICIEICRQLILRKELREICSKPPMPPGQAFLCRVQDHKEAREIYRSAQNFRSDRSLAKELGVSLAVSVSEWEEELRANIELGWPADWVERKYIPPDWKQVFPLIGGPPVGSSENMQAYTELLNAY